MPACLWKPGLVQQGLNEAGKLSETAVDQALTSQHSRQACSSLKTSVLQAKQSFWQRGTSSSTNKSTGTLRADPGGHGERPVGLSKQASMPVDKLWLRSPLYVPVYATATSAPQRSRAVSLGSLRARVGAKLPTLDSLCSGCQSMVCLVHAGATAQRENLH